MTQVHATAIVDPAAELAATVSVGPYAVIGRGVKIDEGTSIGAQITGNDLAVFNEVLQVHVGPFELVSFFAHHRSSIASRIA
jgi:acyl-[acyl carrier protein]--UDP-N-acetylglucosamine O-acyltransferase